MVVIPTARTWYCSDNSPMKNVVTNGGSVKIHWRSNPRWRTVPKLEMVKSQ